MDVFFRYVTSKETPFSIHFDDDVTIKEVKVAISQKESVPIEGMRLLFKSKIISDDAKISEYQTSLTSPIIFYAKKKTTPAPPPQTPQPQTQESSPTTTAQLSPQNPTSGTPAANPNIPSPQPSQPPMQPKPSPNPAPNNIPNPTPNPISSQIPSQPSNPPPFQSNSTIPNSTQPSFGGPNNSQQAPNPFAQYNPFGAPPPLPQTPSGISGQIPPQTGGQLPSQNLTHPSFDENNPIIVDSESNPPVVRNISREEAIQQLTDMQSPQPQQAHSFGAPPPSSPQYNPFATPGLNSGMGMNQRMGTGMPGYGAGMGAPGYGMGTYSQPPIQQPYSPQGAGYNGYQPQQAYGGMGSGFGGQHYPTGSAGGYPGMMGGYPCQQNVPSYHPTYPPQVNSAIHNYIQKYSPQDQEKVKQLLSEGFEPNDVFQVFEACEMDLNNSRDILRTMM
ncbi:hypothetical protein TRFO_36740 [Tritrichomonas foetus]|uniref:UBA domain-containing protein n=1 Tax=Tritrichomonas foetus TaxID=1144522 RepID=A0A1J4JHZ4_9EUKA|nr:hypothetical protein TRFO_36740 [Tritrichomonas foetus]|eukprot:OHS97125.1 hypothetical protein TRFO_36740 [Tritrichomonas foetus]